ncbi:MAG: hypothetical protein HC882_00820 [Acidobacteria bacterium]|nr:hypothetical protein [Acidobacteriota bacterium]
MTPKPKLNDRWRIEAEEETQIVLIKDNGLRLAVERRSGEGGAFYLAAAGIDAKKIRWSASTFRAALPEIFPDMLWGKLPCHSRTGFRALAKVEP